MVLQVTAEVEPGEEYKKTLLKALEPCKLLEQVEVVSSANASACLTGIKWRLMCCYHSAQTPPWNSSLRYVPVDHQPVTAAHASSVCHMFLPSILKSQSNCML